MAGIIPARVFRRCDVVRMICGRLLALSGYAFPPATPIRDLPVLPAALSFARLLTPTSHGEFHGDEGRDH